MMELSSLLALMMEQAKDKPPHLVLFECTGSHHKIITAMPAGMKEPMQIAIAETWLKEGGLFPLIEGNLYVAYEGAMPKGFVIEYGYFYFG